MIYLLEPDSFAPAAKLENRFEAVHTRSGTGAVLYTEHQPTEPALYSIHTDHLGTPMELAECDGKSSGKLAWVGHYRAWGKLTKASDGHGNPSTTDTPLRFQGQYLDEETGLHYNRHRYYDPETGRFTTQDPIGLAGGENLYMYAPNPTGWVDPLGLSGKTGCHCDEVFGNYVDLTTPQRRIHILDGDATGGGHRAGTGIPGKSEFPADWSDDKIIHQVSDVATAPDSIERSARGGRVIREGSREGIDIRVIQEKSGDIVSGFPTNVKRNPQ